MHKDLVYSFIILFTGLLITGCSQQGEDVVITVGDRTIDAAQIRNVLKAKYPTRVNYKDIELDKKKDILQPLILQNLRINEAYALGLDNNEHLKRELKAERMRVVSSKYYERMIVDQIIPDSEIVKIITRQGVEIKGSQILIGFEGSETTSHRSKEDAKKLAEDIIKQLKSGADFGETALKYSEDPLVKQNKGELGYSIWGKMAPPFRKATWNLKIGEISEPVESMLGYHIIKLEDLRKVPDFNPDLSDRNKFLQKQMLLRSYGDTTRVLWLKNYEELKRKFHYVLYEDSIKHVSNLISKIETSQNLLPGSFTSEQKMITLAEYDGNKITLGTLIERFKNNLASAFGNFTMRQALKAEIDRQSAIGLVMIAAEENGFDKLPDVEKELKQITEERLDKLVEQKEVIEKVNPTDQEVKTYYKLNQSSFKTQSEIELWEIHNADEKVADLVFQKARQGANFKKLSDLYTQDRYLKEHGGYLGYQKVDGRGEVSREAYKLGPGGKIGGPVKFRRGWSVFKTGKEKPEKIMEFEEAKARVKNQLKLELTRAAKNKWEASLKDKYTVIIDEEKLKEI